MGDMEIETEGWGLRPQRGARVEFQRTAITRRSFVNLPCLGICACQVCDEFHSRYCYIDGTAVDDLVTNSTSRIVVLGST